MANDKWNQQLELYDALVAKFPQFKRKGKTVPYTSANGYMFSMINKEAEFGIRLPKSTQESFKAKYNSREFLSHGSIMRDYVWIPDELLAKPEELFPYLQESFDFVMSLPPK